MTQVVEDVAASSLEQIFELPPHEHKAHYICPLCYAKRTHKHGICGTRLRRPGGEGLGAGVPMCDTCEEIKFLRFAVRCKDCGAAVQFPV